MNPYEEQEILEAMQEYIESELDRMGYWSAEQLIRIAELAGMREN